MDQLAIAAIIDDALRAFSMMGGTLMTAVPGSTHIASETAQEQPVCIHGSVSKVYWQPVMDYNSLYDNWLLDAWAVVS